MPYLPAARTCPSLCSKIEMRLAMRTFGPLSLPPETVCRPMPDAIRLSLTSSASPGRLSWFFGFRMSDVGSASGILHQTVIYTAMSEIWGFGSKSKSFFGLADKCRVPHAVSSIQLLIWRLIRPSSSRGWRKGHVLLFWILRVIYVRHKISWGFVGIRRKTGCKGCNLLHNANVHKCTYIYISLCNVYVQIKYIDDANDSMYLRT